MWLFQHQHKVGHHQIDKLQCSIGVFHASGSLRPQAFWGSTWFSFRGFEPTKGWLCFRRVQPVPGKKKGCHTHPWEKKGRGVSSRSPDATFQQARTLRTLNLDSRLPESIGMVQGMTPESQQASSPNSQPSPTPNLAMAPRP